MSNTTLNPHKLSCEAEGWTAGVHLEAGPGQDGGRQEAAAGDHLRSRHFKRSSADGTTNVSIGICRVAHEDPVCIYH